MKRSVKLPFKQLIILRNPSSTQAARSQELATQLHGAFGDRRTLALETSPPAGKLPTGHHDMVSPCHALVEHAGKLGPHTLLAIAGGDGTVNESVNVLLADSSLSDSARRTVILPLWGGNANDLAYMLNGSVAKANVVTIMQSGRVIRVYPIFVEFRSPADQEVTSRLATNYISFGASAAAAQAINHSYHRTSRWHKIPGGRLARELFTIASAMLQAPRFRIREDGDSFRVYERAFINGPRFAKVERVALDLAEPQFSVATVERKRTSSLIFHTLRLTDKRYRNEMTATKAHFMVLDPVVAQIDGESLELPAKTDITIRVAENPVYVLSSRFDQSP